MNVRMNASNHAYSRYSQGGNIEDTGANEGVGNRINHIAIVITQMAPMLNQANGMPIPPAVQQLGAEIPRLETSYQNEHSARNGQGQHLQSVTMLEICETLVMAMNGVTIRMKDHAMWLSNLKIAHTKEAINTVICGMTSIADFVDKICVT